MFDHHSEELLAVRMYSTSKKDLLLKTYTYLLDANDQEFYTLTLARSQGDQLSSINKVLNSIQVQVDLNQCNLGQRGGLDGRCGLCACRAFHDAFGKEHRKDQCPAKSMSSGPKSRAVREQFMEAFLADPTINKQSVLRTAIASCT